MKLLIISATDAKGFALAQALSTHHDVTLMHDTDISFEGSFVDCLLNVQNIETCPLGEYHGVIYLASDAISCKYLTILLTALESVPETFCVCVRERGINLSAMKCEYPEKYICIGFSSLLGDRLSFWQTAPIYGDDFLPPELMLEIEKRERKNRICLPGAREDAFDAIHVNDLSAALDVFINSDSRFSEIYLSGNQQATMNDVGSALSEKLSQAEISYINNNASKAYIQKANNPDGWMPDHLFFKDLPAVIERIEDEGHELLRYEKSNRMKRFTRLVGFVLLFTLVCVYTSIIRTSSELQYIDFRLLFVVISSLFWGRRYGLLAAILTSTAMVAQSILGGTKWYVIFFHIDNWIPIAAYLATAVLLGMYHDSRAKDEA